MISRAAGRALLSGTLAAAAVTLAASLATRRFTGSSAAALNATSHFLWGDRAGTKDAYSLKYTGVGFVTNYGASVFWALFYEMLAGRKRRTRSRALVDGALVSAAAYVTDYHIVPKRLTPGWEMRLPRAALACVYAALAFGLSARELIFSAEKPGPGKRPRRTMARYPWDPMKQAASDRGRGLEDTDCRVLDQSSQEHCPRPTQK